MELKRSSLLPLTETTYYILLALVEPAHGYAVMQQVEEMSSGHVRIAAGTMYGALENLLKHKLIKQVPSADQRRKNYLITDIGKKILWEDCQRMEHMVAQTKAMIGRTDNEEV